MFNDNHHSTASATYHNFPKIQTSTDEDQVDYTLGIIKRFQTPPKTIKSVHPQTKDKMRTINLNVQFQKQGC